MGIYDRDYYRQPAAQGEFAKLHMWSITTWLIVINVAVFVIDQLLIRGGHVGVVPLGGRRVAMPPIEAIGHFSAATAVQQMQVWRFITFQFLHANAPHLFFNMLGLYFFGQMMETYLGRNRFLAFYLVCGIAGAAMYLVLWAAGVLVSSAWVPLVGASAGIFGILAAASRVAPRATVMLMFPPMPVELRTWAMILLGLAAATVVFAGANAGGEAAHLGGAIAGYIGITAMNSRRRIGGY